MKHHEKKYRVENFTPIKAKLKELGAKKIKSTLASHYYAQQDGNDVTKLVSYPNRDEIHVLVESNGTFSLKDSVSVKDMDDGFKWLKDKGFTGVGMVNMDYMDYSYNGGIVGLYTINDFLHSVILDFPVSEHQAMEELFGLQDSEVIEVPYNKYLEKIGKLELISLS